MAFERKWAAVAPVSFTQNGSTLGVVTLADTAGFYVKQVVALTGQNLTPQQFQVKWVLSDTQLVLGLVDQKVGRNFGVDVSSFTLANNSQISAGEQDKSNVPDKDHYMAVYEGDPIAADRVILVDEHGDKYTETHPIPIQFSGSVSIGDVTVQGTNGNTIEPNADGSINVVLDGGSALNTINNFYAVAAAVPSGTSATIITYSVPGSITSANLQRIAVSGENLARYDVKVNGNTIETQRTYWGSLNTVFNFMTDQSNGGYPLNPNDIVTVIVLNNSPSGSSAEFEARIQVSQLST